MHDHEQVYPKHQPGRGAHDHHDPFALNEQSEGDLEEGAPLHQRDRASLPQLPYGHARKALIIGVVLGLLVTIQGVVLTLKNADLYREAAKYLSDPGKMPSSIAFSIFGVTLLTIAISFVIYVIGGMVIGRVSVHRRWAFIGGFVGAVISSIVGAILKLIPAYPNTGSTGFSGSPLGMSGGLVALLIGFVLLGVLAGALCLLGAWVTTRRHPYYVGYTG